MSDWASGYVTDLGYTFGFYRELTPRLLWFAGLLKGQATPSPDAPLRYCELGCGQGISINVLAAANRHIEFYATDFNPAHIVGAQALAEEAGTPNLKLYDQSFAEFIDEPTLPEQFDIIVLHGIYSWITPEVRGQITAFLRRKLRPGGLVYCSYNSLPGWSTASPLRHLMYLHGKMTGGPTASRLEPALQFIESLSDKDALFFRANPSLKTRMERMQKMPRNYLAHEYLNDAWTLLYHSDVAREFGDAKLTFLGSAHILDHVDAINLTTDQQAILKDLADPTFRETVRDFMVNQQFRRDLFVRGGAGMTLDEVVGAWTGMKVALTTRAAGIEHKVTGSRGEAGLQSEVYAPLIEVLSEGPRTSEELRGDPRTADIAPPRLQQALAILIGAGHAHPIASAAFQEKAQDSSKAFNSAILRRAKTSADFTTLASPVTGGGVALDRFSQLFLLAEREGADPVTFTWKILMEAGQRLIRDGKTLETEAENIAELTTRLEAFNSNQRGVLQSLGVA